ncbi:F-box protein At3g08750-like [Spinacia oleracea]|uniref:F-box protein At3g08750-like n=1 Tax=Spinacia oleracea TaxID=3562 RepID=A0ABM3RQU4_SPIOL|nr:F-box protein At3g08750-like [Spinacia oleracea]
MANSKLKYDLPHIPDELFSNHILPRLPVKSLIRFKSVCKSWYLVISSSGFVKSHLLHSLSSRTSFFLRGLHMRDDSLIRTSATECFLLYLDEKSKNGHRLLQLDGKFILWNPETKSRRVIETPSVEHLTKCGFGYASNVNDYKIFASFQSLYRKDGIKRMEAWVFEVRGGEWNPILEFPTEVGYFPTGDSNAVCCGDRLYWIVTGFKDNHIMSFCLLDYKFIDVEFPVTKNIMYKLYVSEWCLTLFSERVDEQNPDFEIWRLVQQQSGFCHSWVKWVRITWFFPHVLAFSSSGKCLVHHEIDEIKVVDHVFDEHRHVQGTRFEWIPMHAESHVQSLVSPF